MHILLCYHFAQDRLQNSPICIVGHFHLGINSDGSREVHCTARFSYTTNIDLHTGLQARTNASYRENLCASQSQIIHRFTIIELQGQYPHANQIGSMDALVRLSYDSLNAKQHWSFSGPITTGT